MADPLGLTARHRYVPLSPGISEVIVSSEDRVTVSLVNVIRSSGSSGSLLWVQVKVGAGLPSVSVHVMVMDIPTRVVTFLAGLMVREGCTGEGEEKK